ncbi:MAG: hypothetical protein ABSA30_14560, partial [Candidatus Aminicenantales bacterium]
KAAVEAARKALDKYRTDNNIVAGAVVDDPAYQELKDSGKEAVREYDRLKTALFETNTEWTAAAEALKAERDKEAAAKGDAATGVAGSAARELKKAEKDAAAARAVISAGVTRLKALGVNADDPNPKKKR